MRTASAGRSHLQNHRHGACLAQLIWFSTIASSRPAADCVQRGLSHPQHDVLKTQGGISGAHRREWPHLHQEGDTKSGIRDMKCETRSFGAPVSKICTRRIPGRGPSGKLAQAETVQRSEPETFAKSRAAIAIGEMACRRPSKMLWRSGAGQMMMGACQ